MSDPREIFLLQDDPIGRTLARRLERFGPVCFDDAYDALVEMSHRRCSAVLLSTPREDLDGLARALRRLNQDTRLLGLCRHGDRKSLNDKVGTTVDDFLALPPSRAELNALMQPNPAPLDVPPQALRLEEVGELLSATQSIDALAEMLQTIIARRVEGDLTWLEADDCPDHAEPLLALPGDPSRVLLGQIDQADPHTDTLLNELHALLPRLLPAAERNESLHRLAITDHLTGAYNRRYFYHLAGQILQRANEEHFRASLLLYDIDDFKRYNDEFGHAAGDGILRDTARLIRSITREHDVVARIGGDEFAVLFWDYEPRQPGSEPLNDAWQIADRFRQAVQNHEYESLGPSADGQLSISGGLANFPDHGHTCLELLRQADQALRQAKAGGKNSIGIVGPSPADSAETAE